MLRLVKLDYREKAWQWFLVLTLFICTFDQVAGMIYAHVWVMMSKENPNLKVKTESLAIQKIDYLPAWIRGPAEENGRWALEKQFYELPSRGYAEMQIIKPSFKEEIKPEVYQVRISRDEKDPDCRLFYALDKHGTDNYSHNQQILLENISKTFPNGQSAKCIAAQKVPKVTARYLEKTTILNGFEEEEPYYGNLCTFCIQRVFEGTERLSVQVIETSSGQVFDEYRRFKFYGGWMIRYFFVSIEDGHNPFIYETQSRRVDDVPRISRFRN